ncbi:MAG: exodeoxyribonuclease V subunit alpha [Desulfocapsaceae bacterium]
MADVFKDTASQPIQRFMAAALQRHSGLDGEEAELFQRTVVDLTEALQQGHICITLNEEQRQVISRSAVVDEAKRAPLVLSGKRLYFGRYYGYESELSESLKRLAAETDELTGSQVAVEASSAVIMEDPYQQRAVTIALNKRFCIISGGPGTGKTTLIVSIISQLLARFGPDLRIALTAPTGKAAMRMQESIKIQLIEAGLESSLAAQFPNQAMTLHRLLGLGRRSGRSNDQRDETLNYDVVVVDEASMVDLAMMWRLVKALKRGARLVLLGDRDQLASVESGAVLADCIDSLPENVAELKKSYRFNREIACFAEAVKSGQAGDAWSLGSADTKSTVSLVSTSWLDICVDGYRDFMRMAAKATDPAAYPTVFEQFDRFRVLCALRKGVFGVEEINRRIDRSLKRTRPSNVADQWYPGSPVIITRNDYNLGLYNGDIGICLPDPEAGGGLRIWFVAADGSLKKHLPAQLPHHDPAWALTIHKSQGSEFEEVVVVLPEVDNQVLCRELLYTAITRAREKIWLVANEQIFRAAVQRKTMRYSGLADCLV